MREYKNASKNSKGRSVKLRIAILSDLHCQLISSSKDQPELEDKQESYLLVASPRVPKLRHPIQSLIELIKNEEFEFDAIVSPGDLTNRISPEGLAQAWQHMIEIKNLINCNHIICTIGNHDVDSRNIHKRNDPFHYPRTIHPEFPVSIEKQDQYWSKGFTSIEEPKLCCSFLIINSVIDHHNPESAKRGAFNDMRLSSLEEFLDNYDPENNYNIRIALLHHHPLIHSHLDFTPEDVLANGDQLLDLLAKHNFCFVIHGHRHQPRIRRYLRYGKSVMILASGSFSAYLKKLASTTRNLFHMIEIEYNKEIGINASLLSWEYNHGFGWNPTSKKASGFPFQISFNQNYSPVSPEEIVQYCESNHKNRIDKNELISIFPNLNFCLPDEVDELQQQLIQTFGYKFVFDELGLIHELGKVVQRA